MALLPTLPNSDGRGTHHGRSNKMLLPDPRCHETPCLPDPRCPPRTRDRLEHQCQLSTVNSRPRMPTGWLGWGAKGLYSFNFPLILGAIPLKQTSVLQMTDMIVALGEGRRMLSSQYRPGWPSAPCCPTLCPDPSMHRVGDVEHVEDPARRSPIRSLAGNSGYSLSSMCRQRCSRPPILDTELASVQPRSCLRPNIPYDHVSSPLLSSRFCGFSSSSSPSDKTKADSSNFRSQPNLRHLHHC